MCALVVSFVVPQRAESKKRERERGLLGTTTRERKNETLPCSCVSLSLHNEREKGSFPPRRLTNEYQTSWKNPTPHISPSSERENIVSDTDPNRGTNCSILFHFDNFVSFSFLYFPSIQSSVLKSSNFYSKSTNLRLKQKITSFPTSDKIRQLTYYQQKQVDRP